MELKGLKELQIEIIEYFDLSECLCLDLVSLVKVRLKCKTTKIVGLCQINSNNVTFVQYCFLAAFRHYMIFKWI